MKWKSEHAYNQSTLLMKNIMVDDKHRMLLLSIPKSGCTVWRWTIYNSIVNPNIQIQDGQKIKFIHDVKYLQGKGFRDFRALPQEEKDRLFKSYFNILSVRHPLDRLESCYIDKIVNYRMVDPSYRRGVVYHKLRMENSSSNLKPDLNMKVTFEDFLSYILTKPNGHWDSVMHLAMPCQINYK